MQRHLLQAQFKTSQLVKIIFHVLCSFLVPIHCHDFSIWKWTTSLELIPSASVWCTHVPWGHSSPHSLMIFPKDVNNENYKEAEQAHRRITAGCNSSIPLQVEQQYATAVQKTWSTWLLYPPRISEGGCSECCNNCMGWIWSPESSRAICCLTFLWPKIVPFLKKPLFRALLGSCQNRENTGKVTSAEQRKKGQGKGLEDNFFFPFVEVLVFLTQRRVLCHCFLYNVDGFLVEWILRFS